MTPSTKPTHTPECIPWSGAVDRHGYGRKQVGRKWKLAHRVEWERLRGPIPEGLTIDHLCRNRSCVNVEHMEPVTVRVNVLRGVGATAQNARATHCKAGHPLTQIESSGKRGCRICASARWRAYRARGIAAGTWVER